MRQLTKTPKLKPRKQGPIGSSELLAHRRGEQQRGGMTDEELGESLRSLAERLSKQGNRNYRRYELKCVDRRYMLVRNEICRMVEQAINEAYHTEPEPDDKDGTFLD